LYKKWHSGKENEGTMGLGCLVGVDGIFPQTFLLISVHFSFLITTKTFLKILLVFLIYCRSGIFISREK
jgi:hypothetical protein